MLFMVIEDFRGRDPKAIYRRFRDRGRMMPDGLRFHHSWVAADMSRCFLVLEAEDAALLQQWAIEWLDVAGFEIVPVATSKETVAGISSHLD
jgi:hypothetical protein